jgi:TRAP-type uncharacterized transport system substrate-binding protein
MSIAPIGIVAVLVAAMALPPTALAQKPTDTPSLRGVLSAEQRVREKINEWTVGLAGGLLEGAPIRFATDIARVVDDGENLHVLPIVTRGPSENIEALLYLKGVDAAIINSDSLDEFKTLVPNIRERITYILNLFPSEVHVFVRPEINSIQDLAGKRVNFNTPGTAAAYSGPLIFDRLKIDVQKTFIPHPKALEQMKTGDIAAVVFVTSKPVEAFTRGKWDEGFKFVPIEFNSALEDAYLPTTLSSADYPQLIPANTQVTTIAVPTVLAAFNWPKSSNRYRRVERLVDHLFGRIEKLQEGFHPKWKEVNLSASVPGLIRFPSAQAWLDRAVAREPGNIATQPEAQVDPALLRAQARRAAPNDRAEQDRLFREFIKWQRDRRQEGRSSP